jgi:hypothetical protein
MTNQQQQELSRALADVVVKTARERGAATASRALNCALDVGAVRSEARRLERLAKTTTDPKLRRGCEVLARKARARVQSATKSVASKSFVGKAFTGAVADGDKPRSSTSTTKAAPVLDPATRAVLAEKRGRLAQYRETMERGGLSPASQQAYAALVRDLEAEIARLADPDGFRSTQLRRADHFERLARKEPDPQLARTYDAIARETRRGDR